MRKISNPSWILVPSRNQDYAHKSFILLPTILFYSLLLSQMRSHQYLDWPDVLSKDPTTQNPIRCNTFEFRAFFLLIFDGCFYRLYEDISPTEFARGWVSRMESNMVICHARIDSSCFSCVTVSWTGLRNNKLWRMAKHSLNGSDGWSCRKYFNGVQYSHWRIDGFLELAKLGPVRGLSPLFRHHGTRFLKFFSCLSWLQKTKCRWNMFRILVASIWCILMNGIISINCNNTGNADLTDILEESSMVTENVWFVACLRKFTS